MSMTSEEMFAEIDKLIKKADSFDKIYRLFMNQHLSNEEMIDEIINVISNYQVDYQAD